jgi:alpha-amylase
MKLADILVAALIPLASTVSAADVTAWKSRNIYFALTDRVARSADDSGGDACGNLGNYCGGTFAGLQSKLDYIKGMGFDAIWITPVVASKFEESPVLVWQC